MGDEHRSATEIYLIGRLKQVLGYVPVGTLDLLHVLTHPDVIEHTKEYIEARDAHNRSD